MRFVVVGAGLLLSGCVQPIYAPLPPIELQTYPPPYTYQTAPSYRPPSLAPLGEPFPTPNPLAEPLPSANPPPSDDTGAIPLQQMPAPAADTPTTPRGEANTSAPAAPAPVVARTPTVGPGSNVPLEGFRPMHGQTRPAP